MRVSNRMGEKDTRAYKPDEVINLVTRWFSKQVDVDEMRHVLRASGVSFTEKSNGAELHVMVNPKEGEMKGVAIVLARAPKSGVSSRGRYVLMNVGILLPDSAKPGYYPLKGLPTEVKQDKEFWRTIQMLRVMVDEAQITPVTFPVSRFLNRADMGKLLAGLRGIVHENFGKRIQLLEIIQGIEDDSQVTVSVRVRVVGNPLAEQEHDAFVSLLVPYLGDEFYILGI